MPLPRGRKRRACALSTLLRSTPILDPFSGGLQGGFDQRGGEAFLPRAGAGEVGLEAVDEGQQFIDLGDDAVLFGRRRNWNSHIAKYGPVYVRLTALLFEVGNDFSIPEHWRIHR